MTRRRVVFMTQNGSRIVSEEYNGCKAEFEALSQICPSLDSCDMRWSEIQLIFEACDTPEDFRKAIETVDSFYHSHLDEDKNTLTTANTTYFYPHQRKEFEEFVRSADEVIYVGPLHSAHFEQVTTRIPYRKGYLPTPRHRKVRYRTVEEYVDLDLPCAFEHELVPAFDITDPYCIDSPAYRYYFCRGKLYTQRKGLFGPHTLDMFKADFRASSDLLFGINPEVTREKMIALAQEKLSKFLLVDGFIYCQVNEPFYEVHTYGMGHNHGGTTLSVSWTPPGEEEYALCFNALEAGAAIAKATEVAEKRGDTDSIGTFTERITVLLPEAVTLDFRKTLLSDDQGTEGGEKNE